mgnify:CR=1 FL=1
MKLFIKKGHGNCEALNTDDINVEIIDISDNSYNGIISVELPLLQFENGIQLVGDPVIASIFEQIRKHKNKKWQI